MSTLEISVVVRTRDKEKYFEKVLRTLSLQSVRPSEIIVVNNFSSKKSFKTLILPLALLFITIIIVGGYFLIDRIIQPPKPEAKMTVKIEWENSIAVLPFDDLSPNKDQEYFCDGMTEQIITNLTN